MFVYSPEVGLYSENLQRAAVVVALQSRDKLLDLSWFQIEFKSLHCTKRQRKEEKLSVTLLFFLLFVLCAAFPQSRFSPSLPVDASP